MMGEIGCLWSAAVPPLKCRRISALFVPIRGLAAVLWLAL